MEKLTRGFVDFDKYITHSYLKSKRKWSDAIIKKHLTPILRQNPHRRSAPPMKLYLLSEVEALENREDVKAELNEYWERRAPYEKIAKKRVENEKAKTKALIDAKIADINTSSAVSLSDEEMSKWFGDFLTSLKDTPFGYYSSMLDGSAQKNVYADEEYNDFEYADDDFSF